MTSYVSKTSHTTPLMRLMSTVALALAVGLLAGCQTGRNPRPFWESTQPLPALPDTPEYRVAERPPQTAPVARPRHRPAVPRVSERIVTLGHSVNGVPIRAHVFGIGHHPTLIFGGIHGDEPTATALTKKLLAHVRANPAVLRGNSVVIIPLVNPDGLAAKTRQNARKVDCNRNFPARNWARGRPATRNYGGPIASSEPETRAVILAVTQFDPRCIVSVHSISRGRFCNNYDGPGKTVAQVMAAHNRYPVKASIGYPTPGSFGTWAGVEKRIPTVTLELPFEHRKESQWWPGNRDALLAVIRGGSSTATATVTGQ